MAELDKATHEIVAAFQRFLKTSDESEIRRYSIDQLSRADIALGNRDSGSSYRAALTDRLDSMRRTQDRRYEGRIRALYLVLGIGTAVIGAWLIAKLI